jgi:hypothetical protein
MVDKLAVVDDEKDVSHSKYRQAFAALLNAEDWSCSNYNNTTFGTSKTISAPLQQAVPTSAFQARMKHVRVVADSARRRARQERAQRELMQAYG